MVAATIALSLEAAIARRHELAAAIAAAAGVAPAAVRVLSLAEAPGGAAILQAAVTGPLPRRGAGAGWHALNMQLRARALPPAELYQAWAAPAQPVARAPAFTSTPAAARSEERALASEHGAAGAAGAAKRRAAMAAAMAGGPVYVVTVPEGLVPGQVRHSVSCRPSCKRPQEEAEGCTNRRCVTSLRSLYLSISPSLSLPLSLSLSLSLSPSLHLSFSLPAPLCSPSPSLTLALPCSPLLPPLPLLPPSIRDRWIATIRYVPLRF